MAAIFTSISIPVNAGYGGQGEVQGGAGGDINISISSQPLYFDDHKGMQASINGQPVFCIQRGYPFRSNVSELQMVYASTGADMMGVSNEGTIAYIIRYLLHQQSGFHASDTEFFRGFGEYTINDDHTDAIQTSTDGAPSSLAWQEVFDEDKDDDEDSPYENRYQGTGRIRKFSVEIMGYLTGHEGCLEPFKTQMKEITYEEAGFNTAQLYAQAMMHYYIFEDPDAANYSDYAKNQCEAAISWCIEYNFITTTGYNGSALRISYKDSNGYYGVNRSQSYSGSCDGYIKTTIGGQYEALKLYRQVVWKTVNMREIPSFAERNPNNCEPIKLFWDEDIQKYTATVSDSHGVLNYFNFEIPGVEITNNGDGTLTITSANEINSPLTSLPYASRLEPEDGVFKLPSYYRWNLEGKYVTYKYTALKPLIKGRVGSIIQEANGGSGPGRETAQQPYEYRHNISWGCAWFCETNPNDTSIRCNGVKNNCSAVGNNAGRENNSCDCDLCSEGCTDDHDHQYSCHRDNGWHYTRHEHEAACHIHVDARNTGCYHKNYCPYYPEYEKQGIDTFVRDVQPLEDCNNKWCCGKEHYDTVVKTIEGQYIDWQDVSGVYAEGKKLIDPTFAYIKVITEPHEFPAQTDTEILLIADNPEWNDLTYTLPNGKVVQHSSHLRVGEKFHLKYIYSYEGASKGFKIEFTLENKPYYQYNYLSRMQAPQNSIPIYNLRTGLGGDRFSMSSIDVPYAKLKIDETPITIRGFYKTPETAYTLNGVYSWDSGITWNDKVFLDSLTDDQLDDNYDNKAADDYPGANGGERITTNVTSPLLTDFTVSKVDGEIQVVWEFDTEPEVFSYALVFATSYINVAENDNYTKTYYNEGYNYARENIAPSVYTTGVVGPSIVGVPGSIVTDNIPTGTAYTNWYYSFEEHNNVGGVGYFSWEYTDPNGTQSETLIPSHTIFTQNNEYRTYAVRNKVWQSDVDIKVSNFVQNTGAGITEHTYQDRGRSNHDMNYNLYYTIDVTNPSATIFADKVRAYDNTTDNETTTTPYDTTSDVYEFDVNTKITWGSTGASQTGASYGNTTVVDHIKTGTTYIQREIPTVLNTMISQPVASMNFSIYPNHDRLIYEDHYTGASVAGSETARIVSVSAKDGYYPSNEQSASSAIYSAMNPKNTDMQPQNINGANNVPDKDHQSSNTLQHINPTTSFRIKLSDGTTRTIVDSHTKNYTQYDFEFNPSNNNNKVVFPGYRTSTMFFKYSRTNYTYNGSVSAAVGDFRNNGKTQTESYYISQVLFKSNYTSKYMKELEAQGAEYIKDVDANGNMTAAWIDMVNQNKFAIVSAGQGFELRVTVKYENSLLTQYLARYFATDDAQSDSIGTSNRANGNNEITGNSRQYCNISSLTGKDGRGTPYYKNTARAYISSTSKLDQLAVNLVTGSNVFKDLYVFMSDNSTVYSYSGIYDTPVIFERNISYNEDFSVTTITYTMCVSHENGVSSNLQNMKFYTNQLAPDVKTPGIVEGSYDVSAHGEHSITIWTPVIAATPFDYPSSIQERYLGDAIELGYTIKTTGADDSIVHIVQ